MASASIHAVESAVQNSDESGNLSVVRRSDLSVSAMDHVEPSSTGGSWIAGAIVGGALFGLAVGWLATPAMPGSPANEVQTQTISFPPQDLHAADIVSVARAQTVVPVYYPAPKAGSSTSSVSAAADLEAVKVRNRRLEALVKVLRRRTATERHAPAASTNDN